HANWSEADRQLRARGRELVNRPLLDEVWTDRKHSEQNPVFVHPLKRAGKSVLEKLKDIRREMQSKTATAHVISSLDDVDWTLNLRGSYVEYNRVFLGYVLIKKAEAVLYVNPEQLTEEAKLAMKEAGVEIKPYADFYSDLQASKKEKVWIDPAANQAIFE